MNRRNILTIAGLLSISVIVTAPAWAYYRSPGSPGSKGPPQEAIDACKEKSEGATVEITTPRSDTIKATCKQINGQLVAVPEGGHPGPGNGVPPK